MHFDDFRGVNDFNARIARAVLGQFRLNARFVADQKNVSGRAVRADGKDGARNDVLRRKIPTHRVDGDFHHVNRSNSADSQNLPAFVMAAGRANPVRLGLGATLGAFRQFRCDRTVRRLASTQAHLGHSSFRDTHGKFSYLSFN
jgi:hypothetical protein